MECFAEQETIEIETELELSEKEEACRRKEAEIRELTERAANSEAEIRELKEQLNTWCPRILRSATRTLCSLIWIHSWLQSPPLRTLEAWPGLQVSPQWFRSIIGANQYRCRLGFVASLSIRTHTRTFQLRAFPGTPPGLRALGLIRAPKQASSRKAN